MDALADCLRHFASSYFLATTTRGCWRCEAATRVFGFVLPPGHGVWYVDDDPADDCWEVAEEPTVLSYVTAVADPVAARLRSAAPHYRLDFSQTLQRFYWMNHCERCGAKLGDEYTFNLIRRNIQPFHLGGGCDNPPRGDRGAILGPLWTLHLRARVVRGCGVQVMRVKTQGSPALPLHCGIYIFVVT